MPTVHINGHPVRLTFAMAIGKGGEADVYKKGGEAIKVYKSPKHPDLRHSPSEQDAARRRLDLAQIKLPAFPTKQVPAGVIGPKELVTNANGRVRGFTMPLLPAAESLKRYGDRGWRDSQATSTEDMLAILRNLHAIVSGLHAIDVVIGDFNDLNVLVSGQDAYLIDADSMQYGQFPCTVFTAKFTDPLILADTPTGLNMQAMHSKETDWYAFAVMVMQSLLYVDPYGGVHKPADKRHKIKQHLRPLHRLTVFHDDVMYPRPALPLDSLPVAMRDYLESVFVNDVREAFPLQLLDEQLWQMHSMSLQAVLQPNQLVTGTVQLTTLLDTPNARVLAAAIGRSGLDWLAHIDTGYQRQNLQTVLGGPLDGSIRFAVAGETTLLAKQGKLIAIDATGAKTVRGVDSVGTLPVMAGNRRHMYWVKDGQLMRDGEHGDIVLGRVLANQSVIWAGEQFGFGYYRAGELEQAFIFDAETPGINDSLVLAPIPGNLIDMTCVFAEDSVWFLVEYQHNGTEFTRVTHVSRNGAVLAEDTFDRQPDHWAYRIRGNTAIGSYLFVATDEGVVRIESLGGTLRQTAQYPDTSAVVDASSHLYIHRKGIYVTTRSQVFNMALN